MQETSAITYRKEFSSMRSSGAKSGVCITVEVVDIPGEQQAAVRDALNEFRAKVSGAFNLQLRSDCNET